MELTQAQAEKVHNGKERINFSELKKFDNVKALRLRFVSDKNFPKLDFSYLVVNADNKEYKVDNVPFAQLNKSNWKTELYQILQNTDVYIKDLFDVISINK